MATSAALLKDTYSIAVVLKLCSVITDYFSEEFQTTFLIATIFPLQCIALYVAIVLGGILAFNMFPCQAVVGPINLDKLRT